MTAFAERERSLRLVESKVAERVGFESVPIRFFSKSQTRKTAENCGFHKTLQVGMGWDFGERLWRNQEVFFDGGDSIEFPEIMTSRRHNLRTL